MKEPKEATKKILDFLLTDGGFTKEELAARLKISSCSITNWQKGTRTPSYSTYCFLKNIQQKTIKVKNGNT